MRCGERWPHGGTAASDVSSSLVAARPTGLQPRVAERIFSQIKGFGEYGFRYPMPRASRCSSTCRRGSASDPLSFCPCSTVSRWASTPSAAGASAHGTAGVRPADGSSEGNPRWNVRDGRPALGLHRVKVWRRAAASRETRKGRSPTWRIAARSSSAAAEGRARRGGALHRSRATGIGPVGKWRASTSPLSCSVACGSTRPCRCCGGPRRGRTSWPTIVIWA